MIADIPWYFFMVIRKRNYRSISSFKRPMGHIAHLRNNSNGQSLFLYRALIKREKWLSPFRELKVLIFFKVESPLPKDALCQVWLKWIFRRFKKKFDKEFSLFCYYLPFQKGLIFHFPFTQGCLVPNLDAIDWIPVVLEKKIFKFCWWIFTILLFHW